MNNVNSSWEQHILSSVSTLKNKRVIVRVDWNMPLIDGVISDTSRFDVTVPFLKELSFAGAKIIIMTHFGEKGDSLKSIADHIIKTLPATITDIALPHSINVRFPITPWRDNKTRNPYPCKAAKGTVNKREY